MMLANQLRGEIELRLGEVAILLRPTFERLVAAEAEMGSLVQLVDRVAQGDVRLADAEVLFWHCQAQPAIERRILRAAIGEAGLSAVLGPFRALLAQIFAGK